MIRGAQPLPLRGQRVGAVRWQPELLPLVRRTLVATAVAGAAAPAVLRLPVLRLSSGRLPAVLRRSVLGPSPYCGCRGRCARGRLPAVTAAARRTAEALAACRAAGIHHSGECQSGGCVTAALPVRRRRVLATSTGPPRRMTPPTLCVSSARARRAGARRGAGRGLGAALPLGSGLSSPGSAPNRKPTPSRRTAVATDDLWCNDLVRARAWKIIAHSAILAVSGRWVARLAGFMAARERPELARVRTPTAPPRRPPARALLSWPRPFVPRRGARPP
jgi:hypothetical protein